MEHKFDQRTDWAPPNTGFKLRPNPAVSKAKESDDFHSFMQYLAKYPAVQNIPRNTTGNVPTEKDTVTGKTVVFREDDVLPLVFNAFMNEGFTGAPVLDDDDDYVGYIDLLDIVSFTTSLIRGTRRPGAEQIDTFLTKSRRFKRAKIGDARLAFRAGKRNAPVLRDEHSLLSVMESMVFQEARRVPFLDEMDDLAGMITESMMISTIAQNVDFLGSVGKLPVADMLPDLEFWVDKCNQTDVALTAFETMVDKDRSGLPVVNSAGIVVDSLSARDLRGIGSDADRFSFLWKSVREFKKEVRKRFPDQTPFKPIMVTRESTLREVVDKMDDGNIHRVFVVDDVDTPVPLYVISQMDVLRAIIKHYRRLPTHLQQAV